MEMYSGFIQNGSDLQNLEINESRHIEVFMFLFYPKLTFQLGSSYRDPFLMVSRVE